MAQPVISVLMPVHNSARYLAEAIDSILSQTFGHFELIVVDDGSTDPSRDIVQWYAARDQRIRLFATEHLGVTAALNYGLRHVRGELVARMDADDVSLPERLRQQRDYLQQHPALVAVGCFLWRIDADGDLIGLGRWPVEHASIEAALLAGHGGLPHPAAMIRRQALAQIGGYDPRYPVAQDKDLWLRLGEIGCLANLPEPLLKYREHLRSIGAQQEAAQRQAVQQILTVAYQRRGLPLASVPQLGAGRVQDVHQRRQSWIKAAARSGQWQTAWKHSRQLMADRPLSLATWTTVAQLAGCPFRLHRLPQAG